MDVSDSWHVWLDVSSFRDVWWGTRLSIAIYQWLRCCRCQYDLSVAFFEASKSDHDWAQCAFVVYVRCVIFDVTVSTRCGSGIVSDYWIVFATVGSCWTCDFFAAHACAVLEEMSCLLLDIFCFTSSGISMNANETRKVASPPTPAADARKFHHVDTCHFRNQNEVIMKWTKMSSCRVEDNIGVDCRIWFLRRQLSRS